MTWQEIINVPRHGLGHEIIPNDESVNILAFRFSGQKPMVGYRQENVFYIIWLDRNFTLYDHGN